MMKLYLIGLCMLIVYLHECNAVLNPKVVCYYESWEYYKPGKGKITVNDIDSSLCTHIVYAYMGITDNYQVFVMDPWLMDDLHDLNNFSKIKGNAKAMVSIGGAAQSAKFPLVAANDADRTVFVDSVISFLNKYHFDGVMIDWTYPKKADVENYVKLLDKFDAKFAGTAYSLGITGPPTKSAIEEGYNVRKMVDYVDFIHVMTLDLHGLWDSTVNYAAPLEWQLSSLNDWYTLGAPKHKLLMSIPIFARTWQLKNPAENQRLAASAGAGHAGPYTQVAGKLSYYELCTAIKENPSEWTLRRDQPNTAVYVFNSRDWVSFEDSVTCEAKARNATSMGYGGVVAYAISNEDFHGDCTGTKYPLLHALNKGLNHDDVHEVAPPTATPHVTQATSAPGTDPPGVFKCHTVGVFPDPATPCAKYHECKTTDIAGMWEDVVVTCEHAMVYDDVAHKCVARELVPKCH
jgi:chitinase